MHWPCRLIRLSSSNLNYLIGLGAIILYINIITFVIPAKGMVVASVLCNVGVKLILFHSIYISLLILTKINPWLISLGYSFCYGTIIIKMIRVWVIFNNPMDLKTVSI